jgi:hypothetical protein
VTEAPLELFKAFARNRDRIDLHDAHGQLVEIRFELSSGP